MGSKGQRSVKCKDDNTPFVIYYPYPCYSLPVMGPDGLVSTSIDIGIKNFAIRIERRSSTAIIPMYFNKIDFTKFGLDTSESAGTAVVDPRILQAATQFILSIMSIIQQSDVIGIERQMAVNTKATKMFQHILTILLIYVQTFPKPCIIFDIWSKLKGNILGAPKGLPYNQLKEWTIEAVMQILQSRNDNWSISILCNHKGSSKTKADDLADTVAQMEAWFRYNYRV